MEHVFVVMTYPFYDDDFQVPARAFPTREAAESWMAENPDANYADIQAVKFEQKKDSYGQP